MSISTKLVTVEEFAAMPDEEGMVLELIRGEIVRVVGPGDRHARLISEIVGLLLDHIRRRGKGKVHTGGAIIVARNPDSVLVPDAAVHLGPIPAARDEAERGWEGTPDFVFEVVSPSDSPRHVEDKVLLYLAAGVKAVVLVWPRPERVTVRTAHGTTSLGVGDQLTFEELPGVSIPIDEIFA
jgi:Uma2 family endonuclease